ncbi:MAG: hypothetical protein CBC38_07690 [Gammaproteobacteria bacterium TMED78]|nr:MAG: hypothetical protein CBC38_07690 [Gammaproteobacteria bacterium TMED78]|tara:strand:+ start:1741 stop:2418 length:678 start_codon:yes stop_codon:yes gene_type:complete
MSEKSFNIDWDSIDYVFTDMDGTILDLDFDNFFWLEVVPEKYAEKHDLTVSQSKSMLFPEFKSIQGSLEWYSIDYWSDKLDLDIYNIKWAYKDKIRYLFRAKEFLNVCREMNKRTFLVTNAHPKTLEIKDFVTGIKSMVSRSVCSFDYQYPKENIEFWVNFNRDVDFDPCRTIFIDDNEKVLKSAKDFGIKNLLAIQLPDSSKDSQRIVDFNAVDGVCEILDKYI